MFSGGNTAIAAYFSVDGGNTKLADFGQDSDPGDFLNTGVQGPNDPFNEYYTGSTLQSLTAVDKQLLDALGFHALTPVTTVIEAFGSTSLVQAGSYFYLASISSGSGPCWHSCCGGGRRTSGWRRLMIFSREGANRSS
jgi:serralysin